MAADPKAILALEVPIIVLLGKRTMKAGEVLKLTPGSIIDLPQTPDDDLMVMANNKQIGGGTAVKVGENFGVQVTIIGDAKTRLRAMESDIEAELEAVEAESDEEPEAEPIAAESDAAA